MRTIPTLALFACGFAFIAAGPAGAQVLVAADDDYGIPFQAPLVVEAVGVLDNDTIDGEPAGDNGATAELVADATHGTLALSPDGSFTYTPGPSFDGLDSFVYRAVAGAVTAEATVRLSACTGGPDVYTCWNEAAFLDRAAALGFVTFAEGFEDDAAWGSARSPDVAPGVPSHGILWQSNHPDPPPSNGITTGPGPARTGAWGVFDPDHGYATGTPGECDVDIPPVSCLFHDGFSGTRVQGLSPLHGVGGWVTGTFGANVAIVLDGDTANPLGGGHLSGGHQFFGVMDARPAGFTSFAFLEQDGKVGQALFVFGDDFTLVTDPPALPLIPLAGLAGLGGLLAALAGWRMRQRAAGASH